MATARGVIDGAGDVWTWTALDRDSKLLISASASAPSGSGHSSFLQPTGMRCSIVRFVGTVGCSAFPEEHRTQCGPGGEEHAQEHRKLEKMLAGLERGRGGQEDGAKADGVGPQPRRRATLRREYPDLVTLESAEDDKDVLWDVWPLIVEWRELKAVHPDEGKSLSWLRTEERFLALELTLLEEHELTLPRRHFRCGASTGTARSTGAGSRS